MDDAISFAVPTTSDAVHAFYANPSPETAKALVAPGLLDAAREAAGDDVEVTGVDASVGRGASAYGAAIQVLITIGALGGGVTTLVQAAKVARCVYKALRKRLGYRPNVSLGAAAFLAAADLADRLGHTDFTLLGCGDTNSRPPDQSSLVMTRSGSSSRSIRNCMSTWSQPTAGSTTWVCTRSGPESAAV